MLMNNHAKTFRKRSHAMLLAVLMLTSCIGPTAFAEEESCDEHSPFEPVWENETEPTCIENGSHDEVVYCSNCGEELSRETIVDYASGHIAGELAVENAIPASCTEDGSHDEVVYCTACGEELNRETVADPALGHDWDEGTVTLEPTADTEGEAT